LEILKTNPDKFPWIRQVLSVHFLAYSLGGSVAFVSVKLCSQRNEKRQLRICGMSSN
jgi:hypothetical protein